MFFTGSTFTSAPVSILKSIVVSLTLSFIFHLSVRSAYMFFLSMAFISYSSWSEFSVLLDLLTLYSLFCFVLHILAKCPFFFTVFTIIIICRTIVSIVWIWTVGTLVHPVSIFGGLFDFLSRHVIFCSFVLSFTNHGYIFCFRSSHYFLMFLCFFGTEACLNCFF